MAGMFSRYLSIKTFGYVAGLGFATGCVTSVLPDTYFLGRYVEKNSLYENGEIVPVNKDIQSLTEKILHRIDLTCSEEAVLKFFTCNNKDPLNKGSLKIDGFTIHTGAVIGLPPSFYYTTEDDVEKNFNNQMGLDIDWTSKKGKALKEAILLSEQEKAFAIGREINYCNTLHVHNLCIMKLVLMWSLYTIVYGFEYPLRLNKRLTLLARSFIYSIIGVLHIYLYFSLKKSYFIRRDEKVDYRTATLSPYYAKGGLSYYEKLLNRNIVLRDVLGMNGDALYTSDGNVIADFSKVPLTRRKNNLQDLVQKLDDDALNTAEGNVIADFSKEPLTRRKNTLQDLVQKLDEKIQKKFKPLD